MKVSIIIPSFNQKEFLAEAIQSALDQTVKCEVIVIDDGSTDGSLEIAQGFLPEIKLISQVNKGLASARNTGIMNATGDYILPLDSDDILMDTCVQEILQVAKETNADVIGPSMQTFGESIQTVILKENPSIADFRIGNHLGYFSAVKRSVLLECGGYSPKMVEGYEDLHLWFDLLTRGKKIVTIPKILALYRTKKHSMWRESLKHHKKLMDQIYKDFPDALPKEISSIPPTYET